MQAQRLRSVISATLLLVLGLMVTHVQAGQVALAWNANSEPDLASYKLYYGQSSGSYTGLVDVGNQTTYTLAGLVEGQTYYFAVTAYNTSRNESALSSEVSSVIPGSTPPPLLSPLPPPPPPVAGLTLEAEQMPVHTTGEATGDGWMFWDNGYIANNVDFAQAGAYTFTVRAAGSFALDAWAQLEIRLDGVALGTVAVTSRTYADFVVQGWVEAGTHQVAVAFTNDVCCADGDRNLAVDKVTIAAAMPAALTVEAEQMPVHTSGEATGDGWMFWDNGYIADDVDFAQTGSYTFTVQAAGSYAAGDWAQLEVRLDGVALGTVAVTSRTYAGFVVTGPVTAGTHQVAVAFANDVCCTDGDRNLAVDKITIAAQ